LRDNDNATIMPAPRRRGSHPNCRCLPILIAALHAGSSEKSIEDAIQNAVGRASRTLRQVGWFEVIDTRGHVEDGRVAHYQGTLKVGFTLEDD
jgi:dodecin